MIASPFDKGRWRRIYRECPRGAVIKKEGNYEKGNI
jgi:hypothetical protein